MLSALPCIGDANVGPDQHQGENTSRLLYKAPKNPSGRPLKTRVSRPNILPFDTFPNYVRELIDVAVHREELYCSLASGPA